jgi:hypothetical protein
LQAASEIIIHFFTSWTSAAWHLLLFMATITIGVALTDEPSIEAIATDQPDKTSTVQTSTSYRSTAL